MSRGRVLRKHHIARAELRFAPTTLFVFGDNMSQTGYGGQAKEMRGEMNAVGIPTKWRPERGPGAYFADVDFAHVREAIDSGFVRLEAALTAGYDVVFPADGIGTGLAELEQRAPFIFSYIQEKITTLEAPR